MMASVVTFEFCVATMMLFGGVLPALKPVGTSGLERYRSGNRNTFKRALFQPLGLAIGAVCALVGIGGGTLFVPFLNFLGMPVKRAIGTAAALGLPIGLMGAAGYVVAGINQTVLALPAYCLGYVYLPALAGIAGGSLLTARWGAALSRRLDGSLVKKIFAVFLYAAGLKMLAGPAL